MTTRKKSENAGPQDISPPRAGSFSDFRSRWMQALLGADVTDCAFRVAHALAFLFANRETGDCRPSRETVAEALGRSTHYVRRGIKDLEASGFLHVVRENGRSRACRYSFKMPSERVADVRPFNDENGAERVADLRPFIPERVADLHRKGSRSDTGIEPKEEPKERLLAESQCSDETRSQRPPSNETRSQRPPSDQTRESGEASTTDADTPELSLSMPQADPIDQAVTAWNELAAQGTVARCAKLSAKRRRLLGARLKDAGGLDGWKAYLHVIANHEWWSSLKDPMRFDQALDENRFLELMEQREARHGRSNRETRQGATLAGESHSARNRRSTSFADILAADRLRHSQREG